MIDNISIPEKTIEKKVTFLNTLLADQYALITKTCNAHMHINSCKFYSLHKFLGNQYEALNIIMDKTAEHILSLGHFAQCSFEDFFSVTLTGEENHDFNNPNEIIHSLASGHETIVEEIKNDISPIADNDKDLGTAEFVTELMQQHEKMAWMLRSHLAKAEFNY